MGLLSRGSRANSGPLCYSRRCAMRSRGLEFETGRFQTAITTDEFMEAGDQVRALVHPHESQLEVEKRQRKRRDAAVPAAALHVSPFCCLRRSHPVYLEV